ncbi:unnamed protein product, partial [Discosporangium mesarthrocarpum]
MPSYCDMPSIGPENRVERIKRKRQAEEALRKISAPAGLQGSQGTEHLGYTVDRKKQKEKKEKKSGENPNPNGNRGGAETDLGSKNANGGSLKREEGGEGEEDLWHPAWYERFPVDVNNRAAAGAVVGAGVGMRPFGSLAPMDVAARTSAA